MIANIFGPDVIIVVVIAVVLLFGARTVAMPQTGSTALESER